MNCKDCGKRLGGNNVSGYCEPCGKRHQCRHCNKFFPRAVKGCCDDCRAGLAASRGTKNGHKRVAGYVTPPHIKRRMVVYMRRAKKGLYLFKGYEKHRKDDG